MHNKLTILDCPINIYSLEKTVNIINKSLMNNVNIRHSFVDAGKLSIMTKNRILFESVVTSDIVSPDGQSLVWLSKLYRMPLPEKVSDIDLMINLLELAKNHEYKIFLLGGNDRTLSKVINIIKCSYSPNIIVGFRNNLFNRNDEKFIAKQISFSGADMLFVSLPSPKDDLFIYRNRNILSSITYKSGVGSCFDIISGEIKRLPHFFRKFCLEWIYRFIQQPCKSFKGEVIDSLYFLLLIIINRFKYK